MVAHGCIDGGEYGTSTVPDPRQLSSSEEDTMFHAVFRGRHGTTKLPILANNITDAMAIGMGHREPGAVFVGICYEAAKS
jgi:hypothetical protein